MSNELHYKWNKNLGREVAFETSSMFHRPPYTDTQVVSVPKFMAEMIRGQFGGRRSRDEEKRISKEDLVLDAFINVYDLTPVLGSLFKSQESYLQKMKKYVEENDADKHFRNSLISYADSNLKELAKRQILVGSTLQHHNLSFGDHFVHKGIPSHFDAQDWGWVNDAAKWFRTFTRLQRVTKFTVPIGTSQGFLLKSAADGPMWRTVSKGLQASLALKARDYKQFKLACEKFDELFAEYGSAPLSTSYFLGLRRQHSVKAEVIDNNSFMHPHFTEDLDCSEGLQGRARGIFPPPEFAKVYYKPFAEGLKKALFLSSDICSVDQSMISSKLHYIRSMSQLKDLYHMDKGSLKGWLTFYDLSGYDTCTHAGCGRIYDEFCRSAFDNWDSIEGEHFKDFNIVFPLGVRFDSTICSQQVKNRSTQSGQPDVTVKNNVVHLLLLSHSLSVALKKADGISIKPLDIFKQLISGSGPVRDMTALMHGDDAAVYFSDNPEAYLKMYDEMTALGIVTSSELYSVYLKKTPHLSLSLDSELDNIALQSKSHVIHKRNELKARTEKEKDVSSRDIAFSSMLWSKITSLGKSNNRYSSLLSKLREEEMAELQISETARFCLEYFKMTSDDFKTVLTKLASTSNHGITKAYNKDFDPLFAMQGMPGSLARNRFGEYGSKDIVISLLSLYDTWLMLPDYTSVAQRLQWCIMAVAAFMSANGKSRYLVFKENITKEISGVKLTQAGKATEAFIDKVYAGLNDNAAGDGKKKMLLDVIDFFCTDSHYEGLLNLVTMLTLSAQTKAKTLRGYLDRLYYSNGEQFLDDSLEQIYGSIQYDPEDMSSRLGISSLNFNQTLEICLKYQRFILQNHGLAPSDFDDVDTSNLKDILKYQ